jgi:hypothetical protein
LNESSSTPTANRVLIEIFDFAQNTMAEWVKSLEGLNGTKWYIHERVMACQLAMIPQETKSVREQLSILLAGLKKGGFGSKHKKTWISTGHAPMDLEAAEGNSLNVHYLPHGDREEFARAHLAEKRFVHAVPRYFWVGVVSHVLHPITIRDQLDLLEAIMGKASSLNMKTRIRRQSSWLPFLNQERGSIVKQFREEVDVPNIARQFEHLFDGPQNLTGVEHQIRELLLCSNVATTRRSSLRRGEGVTKKGSRTSPRTSSA